MYGRKDSFGKLTFIIDIFQLFRRAENVTRQRLLNFVLLRRRHFFSQSEVQNTRKI